MAIKNWFLNFLKKIKSIVKKIWEDKSHLFWYVCLLYFVAIAFCFTTLVGNDLTLPLAGDYVLQQIPFYTNGYDDWMTFFKTGEFPLWDHNTFLGANNIGANSFYYILNPFFLPILLWPRDYIAQGLAFLMITKMVLAGLVFRKFLKYIGLKEDTSRLFGIAYAFCGWNLYYLWFNHFLEVCVVFPLVLWGIEKVVREKKPWLLMASLGLMGMCNYFFLVSTCFAGLAYALYRYFSEWKKNTPKDRGIILGLGVCGFIVGIMIGAITLLPALPVVLESPRVEDATYLEKLLNVFKEENLGETLKQLWKLLTKFDSPKQAYYPLMSFLFPTISGYNAVLFNNYGYDNTLSSIFIFTPLMMFLVPSILNSIRKKRIKNLIALGLILFALFTPIFYYLSYGFTLPYGRWEILVVAAALIFIAQNFEEREEMPRWYFDISFGVVAIGVIIAVSFALSIQNDLNGSSVYPLGDRVFVIIGQCIYIVVCYLYLRFKHKQKELIKLLIGVVSIEAIVMGTLTFNFQSPSDYSTLYGGLANVQEEQRIIRAIQEQDDGFYRIFNSNADRNSNNLQMREGYNGVAAFHSVYNYNVFDFVQWSRVGYSYRNWSMGVHEKRYNLDEFLNIKYYIQKCLSDDGTNVVISNNIPHGYVEMTELSTRQHKVYRNTNHVELGYAFDSIMVADSETDSSYHINDIIYQSGETLNKYINVTEAAYLSTAIVYENDLDDIQKELPNIPLIEFNDFNSNINIKKASTSTTLQFVKEQANYQDYYNQIKADHPYMTDEEIDEYIKLNFNLDISNYEDQKYPEMYQIENYTWGSKMIITPLHGNVICPSRNSSNPEDDYCYISLNLRMGENLNVHIYDVNGHLITWDNHMWHYYDNSGDWKYNRGFYVDRPVGRIEVLIYANYTDKNRKLPYPYVHYEYYSDYKDRVNKLKENAFENIKVSNNHIDFDTNYEEEKMIVLSIPYDSGWNGYYKDSQGNKTPIKTYKAQGGFLAFASKIGDTHYSLVYDTPLLKEGLLLFVSGLTIMVSTWGAVYISERRRKKNLELLDSPNENIG